MQRTTRGCTRHAAIRPNNHQRNGNDRSIYARKYEDRSCGYALSRGNLVDLLPARFPKMGSTGSFRPAERSRKRLGVNFIRKLPRPILKTEIVQRTEPAYWVLSQRALCSPNQRPPASPLLKVSRFARMKPLNRSVPLRSTSLAAFKSCSAANSTGPTC
jgi:hypothetical protein